jgi:hypothetical protein
MNEAFAPFKFVGKDIREDKYEEMKRFFEWGKINESL